MTRPAIALAILGTAATLAACGSASASAPRALVVTCTSTIGAAGTHSACRNNVQPGTPQPSWLIAR